ncbi:hypothetical protein [Actinokineospora diospyrosa]|uniref:Uncharacterized protein n=1 Tax=Actinokineospora diospyrosa TaxID=103728 RepID=A0ABT1IHG3_9PSEU|nr:hypothetical protein [Actinokineospora diospyrosa]MCP2272090.1 hypothetical protein [Actinokineospora diospyrosa]
MTSNYQFEEIGNVNNGPGPQFNLHITQAMRRRRERRFIAAEEIHRRAQRFVEPRGYPFAAFSRSNTAVLAGSAEAGTRTTALMLLTERGTRHVDHLRVLDYRADDRESALDTAELRPQDRLLLDLCAADDSSVVALRSELETYQAAVGQARLVVLVRPNQVDLLADSLAALHIHVERPDGAQVLRAHLAAEGITPPDPLLATDRLARFLRSESTGGIAALARLVVKARDTKHGDNLADWLTEALAAQSERAAQARKLFSGQQGAADRALLTVAAFLPGAPVEALATAEAVFHEKTAIPAAQRHTLDGAHLAERMAAVNLRVDGHDRVEFADLALDGALRTHFWTYFPTLRDGVAAWVQEVAPSAVLPYSAKAELVDRFADVQLATGPAEPLRHLVRAWATGGHPDLAAQVLAIGLRHDGRSKEFRRYVYDWSRERELPEPLARVLIEACVEDIAPNQPPQALVRLRHLTRHSRTSIRDTALDALLGQVRQYGFQRWLLYHLRKYNFTEHDHAILANLDIPVRLAREHQARDNLLELWRQMLSSGTRAVPQEGLWTWIGRDPDLVVRACDGNPDLLNQLFVFTRERVRHAIDPEELRVAHDRAGELLRHIDAAPHVTTPEGQG